jgi:putative ABC transport system permease protein
MAVAGAELAAWGLQTQVLDLSYQPTFWLWPLGVIAGVLLIASLGLWSCRHVVSTPPLVVLREL